MPSHAQESEAEEVMDQSMDDEEESQEDTYIEILTQKVVSEQQERIGEYVDDPQTPEELSKNRSIKKFLVQMVRNKLLDSFESQLKWVEDADLVAMVKKWKRVTSSDEEVDATTAMKRIIKDSDVISEVVEQHLEELSESAEEE